MDTGTQRTAAAEAAWKRHGRMWKVIGVVTLLFFVASRLLDPTIGIPLLFAAMAFFVATAWHAVLYYKGARERSASASPS
jgi:hypothetical protein